MASLRSLAFLAAAALLGSCSLDNGPASDGSAPLVGIDAPAANATVAGSVAIDVTAVDDFGVDKVRILIDGVLLTELFSPPFHAVWNTQSVTNNTSHVIRVEASDVAGNVGSKSISVTVQNGVNAPPATPQ